MTAFYKIVCGRNRKLTQRVTGVRVGSTSITVTSEHTLPANVGIKSTSALMFGLLVIWDIVEGPCLLSETLSAQRYRSVLSTVLLELLEDATLLVRQILWLHHDRTPYHSAEMACRG
jgi:hypothetical protein